MIKVSPITSLSQQQKKNEENEELYKETLTSMLNYKYFGLVSVVSEEN